MRSRFVRVVAAAALVALSACGRAPAPQEKAASASPAPAGQVTYTRDVAPILFANCAPCHRPGQVAPFSLLSYDEARKKAAEIADVTSSRQMPPWLPESGSHALQGDRRLRDRDIQILQTWAKAGAPEGRPEDLPGAEQMVGLTINTIPVRARWSAQETLETLAQRLQEQSLAHEARLGDWVR